MNEGISQPEKLTIYSNFFEYQDKDTRHPRDPAKDIFYVVDTNVLLNLFKYTKSTAEQLLEVLEHMRDVLFVPHQVLEEFWPRLEEVRQGSHHREAKGKVDTAIKDATREVEVWLKRTGLEAIEEVSIGTDDERSVVAVASRANTALRSMTEAATEIGGVIDEVFDQAQENAWILQRIDTILSGRVGPAPDSSSREQSVATFKQRISEGLPPGNRDVEIRKGKAEKAIGDYLIWSQALQEASTLSGTSAKSIDLTLITNDLKDDWTRESGPDPLPRRELVREYSAATNGGVFRIRTFKHLIDISTQHFGARPVDAVSMAQVDAVESAPEKWSVETTRIYLEELHGRDNYRDQLTVLLTSYCLAKAGLSPITFSEARALTGRENLVQFASPYRTILNMGPFDEISRAMIWSQYDERGENTYEFNGDPLSELERVVNSRDAFAEIALASFQKLADIRGLNAEDYDIGIEATNVELTVEVSK